jgi:hypothetical protein
VDEAVGKELGKVEISREKSIKSNASSSFYQAVTAGILKSSAYFIIANTLVPEEHRFYSNIAAGLLTAGNMFSRFPTNSESSVINLRAKNIEDRLNIPTYHHPK